MRLLLLGGVVCAVSAWAGPADAYLLGPNDKVTVHALHVPEIPSGPIAVDSAGNLTLPLVGAVKAASLSVPELQAEIASRLKTFVRDPLVTVSIAEYCSQPVSVMGAVTTPGVYYIQGNKTLMDILAKAGGARPDASDRIHITRRTPCDAPLPNAGKDETGRFTTGEVKLINLLQARTPAENPQICPNDLITVSRAPLIYVMGEVRKPGGQALLDRETCSVLEAVSLAEGLLRTSAAGNARVLRRRESGDKRQEIAVDVNKILRGKLPDFMMQADDILVIPNSASKSAAMRAVETALQVGTGVVIWRR